MAESLGSRILGLCPAIGHSLLSSWGINVRVGRGGEDKNCGLRCLRSGLKPPAGMNCSVPPLSLREGVIRPSQAHH